MKTILEEYGEIVLAIVGAVGVMGMCVMMLWGEVAQSVTLFAESL